MRYSERVLGTSSLRREEEPSPWERPNGRDPVSPPPPFVPLKQYLTAVAGVAALTIACWFLTPLTGYASISLIYLLGVLLFAGWLDGEPVPCL